MDNTTLVKYLSIVFVIFILLSFFIGMAHNKSRNSDAGVGDFVPRCQQFCQDHELVFMGVESSLEESSSCVCYIDEIIYPD